MAFKLTVDFNKLSLVVQTDAAEPTTTFIYAQSSVTHTHAEAVSAYTLMSFSDVFLDPDTKNLYFTTQFDSPNALTISMSAGISTINVAKVLADTPVLEELAAKHLDKGAADTSTLSDNFSRVVSYVRSFTDAYQFVDDQSLNVTKLLADTPTITEDTALSVSLAKSDSTSISESAALLASLVKADTTSMSEAITSVDTSLGKSDSITPTESTTILSSLAKTETLSVAESSVLAPNLNKSETISMPDSFSRVVQYVRGFADAFTLDDVASGTDELQTDTSAVKGNIATLTEVSEYSFSKGGIADSFSVSEATAISFSTSESDGVSVAESLVSATNLGKADSATITESLVQAFSKAASDSTSVTESLSYSASIPLTESLSIAESTALLAELATSDTFSVGESSLYSFSKSLTDSATMSESISVLFIPGGSGVLNTAALNTSVLN